MTIFFVFEACLKEFMIAPVLFSGGEDEIRTHDTCYSIAAFQATAFNRSATSPQGLRVNGKIKRPL
jgi:hypothetical protein